MLTDTEARSSVSLTKKQRLLSTIVAGAGAGGAGDLGGEGGRERVRDRGWGLSVTATPSRRSFARILRLRVREGARVRGRALPPRGVSGEGHKRRVKEEEEKKKRRFTGSADSQK